MSGRDALSGHAMWRWADEGVAWLIEQGFGKEFEFSTAVDVDRREVFFRMYRRTKGAAVGEIVLELVEPIESFVSHLTVTKIILIAG